MVSLSTKQKFLVTLTPDGAIDGPPTWAVSPSGIVTLAPSADGLSCEVIGLATGTATVTPSATAGGNLISGLPIACTVTAVPATTLAETIGPVVSQ